MDASFNLTDGSPHSQAKNARRRAAVALFFQLLPRRRGEHNELSVWLAGSYRLSHGVRNCIHLFHSCARLSPPCVFRRDFRPHLCNDAMPTSEEMDQYLSRAESWALYSAPTKLLIKSLSPFGTMITARRRVTVRSDLLYENAVRHAWRSQKPAKISTGLYNSITNGEHRSIAKTIDSWSIDCPFRPFCRCTDMIARERLDV